MTNELIQSIGLGVAGIDPFGAMLLFAAIRAGAERSKVVALTISTFIATVVAGVILALVNSQFVETLPAEASAEAGAIWAYLEIGVAFLIGYWLIRDSKCSDDAEEKKRRRPLEGKGISAYIFAGVAFSATALIDPTFLAIAVVVADINSLLFNIFAFSIWTLISQFMLFGLFAAYLYGLEQRLAIRAMALWQRHQLLFKKLLYITGVIAMLLLLADAIYYMANGRYYSW